MNPHYITEPGQMILALGEYLDDLVIEPGLTDWEYHFIEERAAEAAMTVEQFGQGNYPSFTAPQIDSIKELWEKFWRYCNY